MSARPLAAWLVATVATVAIGALHGCAAGPSAAAAPAPAAPAAPRLVVARGDALVAARARLRGGDPTLRPAYDALLHAADSALLAGPWTVVEKRHVPPSGDRHDFMSLAPYWWPDTTKTGGLPYVRRDGEVNPESRVDHDGTRFQAMADAVETLALAGWLSGEPRYGARAALLLRTWFVDSATRMNPNLRFAQAVLGVNEGRGTGIIDLRDVPQLLDAVRLLEGTSAWSAADRAAFAAWCRDYLAWLRTSPNGRDEAAAENNHGTWYDTQVAALALFLGDSALARETVAGAARRLDAQVKPDGSQPLELARTRPLHYSLFNLDAFTQLAEMGRALGVDLWHHAAPGGGGLLVALRALAPYADPATPWPTAQAMPVTADVFFPPFARAALATGDPAIVRARAALPATQPSSWRDALLYPLPATSAIATARDSLLDHAFAWAQRQLRHSATTLDPANGYPRVTRADGSWEQQPYTQWTSGFFAGSLWYMYQATHDTAWRTLADRWTAGIEPAKSSTTTHDLGFMIFDSFGHGYLLTGDPRYRAVVMEASRSLATRFNPTVGAIKSWDTERAKDRRGAWKYPVIVDNLMNLEMLFWAAANGGDSAWARMATSHALVSSRAHLRADGSTAHVALFDPATGRLEGTTTWQGFSDSSAWARGQAWAIHGFAASYRRSRRAEVLAAAQRAADWFIAHLPADAVPWWDFRDPAVPNVERDASAAAIAASGLLDLARWSDAPAAARDRAAADRILESLARSYLTEGTSSAAVLQHSVGAKPLGSEIDVGIVYADYFFLEALLRRRGLFLE